MANCDRQIFSVCLCYNLLTLNSTTFTCTSGGTLRRTSLIRDEVDNSKNFRVDAQNHVDLPSRLCDWRLSEDGLNFAYGGDEVDVSLWNTDRAFQTANSAELNASQSTLKRRRKNQDLYPGEVWRARNVIFLKCWKFRWTHATIAAKRPPGSETSSSDHYPGLPPILPRRVSSHHWNPIW